MTLFVLAFVLAVLFATCVAIYSRSLALPACQNVETMFQTGIIQYLAVTWNLDERDPRNILPVDMIIEGNAIGEPWILEGRNGGVRLGGPVPSDVFNLWIEWHKHTAEALHCFDLLRARRRVDVSEAIDGKPGSLIATPRSRALLDTGGRPPAFSSRTTASASSTLLRSPFRALRSSRAFSSRA